MIEDKTARDIELGKRAKILMDDDLLMACFEALRQDFADAWSNATTTEDREMIWSKQAVLGEVKQKLLTLVNNGKIASKRLQN